MAKTQISAADVQDASLTDADIAVANKDGAKATPSMRTLSAAAPTTIAYGDVAAAGAGVDASSSDHRHGMASAGGIPAGIIAMWAGTVVSIPSGWALCDGTLGTPNLSDRFIIGETVTPGGTGGTVSPAAILPAHSNHAVTQPAAHAAHIFTQPAAHAAHIFTQPAAHAEHVVTQPAAHAAHIFTQPAAHAAHIFTQAAAHAEHVVTQAATHASHAPHDHELPFAKVAGSAGGLRLLAPTIFGTGTSRNPESAIGASASTTLTAVLLSEAVGAGTHGAHTGAAVDAHSAHTGAAVDAHSAHTGGGVDAHSAHSGAAVDAHSAHSGAAVDAHSAHSGAAVDAHSAHSGAAVDAHSAHSGAAVDAHSAHSAYKYFLMAFIQKL